MSRERTRVKIVFRALQKSVSLPARTVVCRVQSVCVCVCVCGLSWKHVLAAFCVNVRRTWGRSHYHPPYPSPVTPPPPPNGAFIPSIPWQAPTTLPLSLCIMVNNTLPHSRSVIAKRGNKKINKKHAGCLYFVAFMHQKIDKTKGGSQMDGT